LMVLEQCAVRRKPVHNPGCVKFVLICRNGSVWSLFPPAGDLVSCAFWAADVWLRAGAVAGVRDHGWAAAGDGFCGGGGPLT
jgi:hypothetical protein